MRARPAPGGGHHLRRHQPLAPSAIENAHVTVMILAAHCLPAFCDCCESYPVVVSQGRQVQVVSATPWMRESTFRLDSLTTEMNHAVITASNLDHNAFEGSDWPSDWLRATRSILALRSLPDGRPTGKRSSAALNGTGLARSRVAPYIHFTPASRPPAWWAQNGSLATVAPVANTSR